MSVGFTGGATRPAPGQGVQIERALDVLEWLAGAGRRAGPDAPGLSEVALGVDQPKATVYRLLTVLCRRGYVSQDAQAGYRLGIKCFELGNQWERSFDLGVFAGPYLERLNAELAETVQLAVYDDGDVVYVERLESTQLVIARPDTANRAPATVVSTGRAILAFQPEAEIRKVLQRPLPTYTEFTPTGAQEVGALLAQVRRDGFAVNRQTYRLGICGLAAPIRDSTGSVIASVGILVPEHRFGPETFEIQRAAIVGTAVAISSALGGPAQLVTSAQ
ncbi:MAG TPA: IclR family transcriptional regulator [Pseudonocardia sp.]|jgi:DNA-binding IclR family transcriptional regulator|nr:IclR family transcriptional regulator [Pseudonocardia sp.]